MRVLLFTGKGGVGKTTAAAATAVHAARAGVKTLVLSTDGAHSLADALGVPLSGEPQEVEPGLSLWAQQVDTQAQLERTWSTVAGWLADVLERQGVDRLQAEEISVLPGAEEVLALLEVRAQAGRGTFDLVVVDCAPTAETLRLLALPQALAWYMDRIWPRERRALRALRPLLGGARAGTSMPSERVLDAVERLHTELSAVHALLTDPVTTAVTLVLTPEAVVVAEARRALTSLSLLGLHVDAVLANRIVPDGGDDPWRRSWAAAQQAQLAQVRADFAPLPVRTAAYASAEPVGLAALQEWAAATYADAGVDALLDASGPSAGGAPEVTRTADGWALTVALPFAVREELELARTGDDLVVTVGGLRRVLPLSPLLQRCSVHDAVLRDGRLVVRFLPDPAQWPDVLLSGWPPASGSADSSPQEPR